VGDVPLVGSGAYADNRSAAASATGDGDKIMRVVLSKTVCDLAGGGLPAAAAAKAAIATLAERTGGTAGIIIIDRNGRTGFAHNTPRMSRAWIDADGTLQAGIEPAAGST
jgi:beta-aspartyl-peptidase (threonine type)